MSIAVVLINNHLPYANLPFSAFIRDETTSISPKANKKKRNVSRLTYPKTIMQKPKKRLENPNLYCNRFNAQVWSSELPS